MLYNITFPTGAWYIFIPYHFLALYITAILAFLLSLNSIRW